MGDRMRDSREGREGEIEIVGDRMRDRGGRRGDNGGKERRNMSA